MCRGLSGMIGGLLSAWSMQKFQDQLISYYVITTKWQL